mmetsp:Transcript_94145/g.196448  ORF Transcript_94145/g.196448 Transcript_94145/m.196448 type:complete len:209 (+) Transcript_94145:2639-3265(+)
MASSPGSGFGTSFFSFFFFFFFSLDSLACRPLPLDCFDGLAPSSSFLVSLLSLSDASSLSFSLGDEPASVETSLSASAELSSDLASFSFLRRSASLAFFLSSLSFFLFSLLSFRSCFSFFFLSASSSASKSRTLSTASGTKTRLKPGSSPPVSELYNEDERSVSPSLCCNCVNTKSLLLAAQLKEKPNAFEVTSIMSGSWPSRPIKVS